MKNENLKNKILALKFCCSVETSVLGREVLVISCTPLQIKKKNNFLLIEIE